MYRRGIATTDSYLELTGSGYPVEILLVRRLHVTDQAEGPASEPDN
jgi:hypothetical protein